MVAIGDLHGDLHKARRAFRVGGLIDEHDRWIGGTTTAVQVRCGALSLRHGSGTCITGAAAAAQHVSEGPVRTARYISGPMLHALAVQLLHAVSTAPRALRGKRVAMLRLEECPA